MLPNTRLHCRDRDVEGTVLLLWSYYVAGYWYVMCFVASFQGLCCRYSEVTFSPAWQWIFDRVCATCCTYYIVTVHCKIKQHFEKLIVSTWGNPIIIEKQKHYSPDVYFIMWALSAVETPTSSTDLPSLYLYFVADSNSVARLTSLKMAQDRRKQLLSSKYNQR